MTSSIDSLAYRNLRKLSRYLTVLGDTSIPSRYAGAIQLAEDDVLVGIYENTPGTITDCLVFTHSGIQIHSGSGPQSLKYADILSVNMEKSPNASSLEVSLLDGRSMTVRVTGGDAATGSRDVAAVVQFLMRVVGQLREERA
jgi:hypothetical protein